MSYATVRKEIQNLTNDELVAINHSILDIIEERRKYQKEQALNEMTDLLEKWAEQGVRFYIYDDKDHDIFIYAREVCVTNNNAITGGVKCTI